MNRRRRPDAVTELQAAVAAVLASSPVCTCGQRSTLVLPEAGWPLTASSPLLACCADCAADREGEPPPAPVRSQRW